MRPALAVLLALTLTGCRLFGGASEDDLPEIRNAPYPDLAVVPERRPDEGQASREATIRSLEARRVLAELERDVLDPALLERLPSPPVRERDPFIPKRLIDEAAARRAGPSLVPPPAAMPPVLPAGGVPGERPEDRAPTGGAPR